MKCFQLLVLVMTLAFTSCKVDQIEMVKSGTFNASSGTLIGKSIDASFGQTNWRYFENEKGQQIVEVTGVSKQNWIDHKMYLMKTKVNWDYLSDWERDITLREFKKVFKMMAEKEKTADPADFDKAQTLVEIFETVFPVGGKITLQFVIDRQAPSRFEMQQPIAEGWLFAPDAEEIVEFLIS